MLEMLEQSGVLTEPGMGTVFLVVVLLCYLAINKISKARKVNNNADTLQAGKIAPSQPGTVNNAAAVTAAIAAALTEYRKYNSL
jgi:Na+-transporting methylmalonyl-CoA/oxaloacetate decarboxylase gamma subunit